jgi:hypothetical protein
LSILLPVYILNSYDALVNKIVLGEQVIYIYAAVIPY